MNLQDDKNSVRAKAPYTLTLTHDERRAIDWIGHRYFHGDDLFSLLQDCVDYQDNPDSFGDSWDDPIDWTLKIPEHIAWEIRDGIAEENYELACFSVELRSKLLIFCDSIV